MEALGIRAEGESKGFAVTEVQLNFRVVFGLSK